MKRRSFLKTLCGAVAAAAITCGFLSLKSRWVESLHDGWEGMSFGPNAARYNFDSMRQVWIAIHKYDGELTPNPSWVMAEYEGRSFTRLLVTGKYEVKSGFIKRQA